MVAFAKFWSKLSFIVYRFTTKIKLGVWRLSFIVYRLSFSVYRLSFSVYRLSFIVSDQFLEIAFAKFWNQSAFIV